jgi:hypothetical protein
MSIGRTADFIVNVENLDVLREHKVGTVAVLPGSYYLSCAIRVFSSFLHSNKIPLLIKDIEFLNPIYIKRNGELSLRVVLNIDTFELTISDVNSDKVSSKMQIALSSEFPSTVNSLNEQESKFTKYEKGQFYTTVRNGYTGKFASVQNIHSNDLCSWSSFNISIESCNSETFAAVLMDNAFHVLIAHTSLETELSKRTIFAHRFKSILIPNPSKLLASTDTFSVFVSATKNDETRLYSLTMQDVHDNSYLFIMNAGKDFIYPPATL